MEPYKKGDLAGLLGQGTTDASLRIDEVPTVALPSVKPKVSKTPEKVRFANKNEINRVSMESSSTSQKEDSEEKKQRTLFLGNVPVEYPLKKIKTLCRRFGEVESCRMRSVPMSSTRPKKVAFALKEFNEDVKTANVYVVFKDPAHVQAALQLNGEKLDGHIIRADKAVSEGDFDGPTCIFLGDLPFNCSDEAVHEALSHFGKVLGVRLVRDRNTGVGKGIGFARFSRTTESKKALRAKTIDIYGRSVRIQPLKKPGNEEARKERIISSTPRKPFTGTAATKDKLPRGLSKRRKRSGEANAIATRGGIKKAQRTTSRKQTVQK